MSTITVRENRQSNRKWLLWLVAAVLLVAIAAGGYAAWSGSAGGDEQGVTPDTPAALWQAQEIDNYRYVLQVGCFCLVEMVRPVEITVRDGELASIVYVEDGSPADPQLFERYSSIDKLFAVIDEAAAQEPAKLDVSYDETTGVPLSVDIDISEMMADEELYLTVSDFEALP